MKRCTHMDQIRQVTPGSKGCEECLKEGTRWVHLRLCLTCGHVGCCDSSIGKHATKHSRTEGHPVIQSFEPGDDWMWCNNYLLKPWDPPELNLYPVVDDLLGDWISEFRPRFTGLRLLGTRWSPQSHYIRDFLARNQIPYQWLDVEQRETDSEVRRTAEAA